MIDTFFDKSQFYREKTTACRQSDELTAKALLWFLYALTLLFICCQHSWMVYTFEYYVLDYVVWLATQSGCLVYGSIDYITLFFIIIWYIEQAGTVKMNLTKQIRLKPHDSTIEANTLGQQQCPTTMGIDAKRTDQARHRYAQLTS